MEISQEEEKNYFEDEKLKKLEAELEVGYQRISDCHGEIACIMGRNLKPSMRKIILKMKS